MEQTVLDLFIFNFLIEYFVHSLANIRWTGSTIIQYIYKFI